jgi:hypothetical protein
MGHVENGEPETHVLADKLLAPLAGWDIGPAPKAGAASPSESPAPRRSPERRRPERPVAAPSPWLR